MNKEQKLKIIESNISTLENNGLNPVFKNGGYSYSKNITNIFTLLDEYSEKYYKFEPAINKKNEVKMQNCNFENYALMDCIYYFNTIWHLETGIAVGIVISRVESGEYLKALKRFKNLIENEA